MEAIVEFEYAAQEDDELSLKVGEIITNVSKASEGWCEGTLNGRKGMFPDNFVKMIEAKKEAKLPAKRQNSGAVSEIRSKLNSVILPGGVPPSFAKKPIKRVKVTFAYAAQQDDELSLELGNIIEVLKQDDPNWWEGSLNGKVGMFPSNFVETLGQAEGDRPGADEVPEIRGRKVEGVGFGNIFAGGQIVLRSKGEKDARPPPQIKQKPAVPTPAGAPNILPQASKGLAKPVQRARVAFPYAAANDDELDLNDGDIVVILDQNLEDDGWWKGELNGKIGVFPDNFVELIQAESEKPPKPAMPPPPTAASLATSKTQNVPPIDPQKAKLVKKEEPKVTRPMGEAAKSSDLYPNLETDDSKAKKNKEFVRTGTLDSVKPNENTLSHPTAFRAKPPVRRPPAASGTNVAVREDEKPASVAKVQPQVPLKDDHFVNFQRIKHEVAEPSSSGFATNEQYVELQREVAHLRDALEQTKRSQDKRLNDLMAEIDEEKKVRLNLQVELERLKKMITS